MGYLVTSKTLLYSDAIKLKKMIAKKLKIHEYIQNPKNAEILLNFLFKHFFKKADKCVFIHKDFKLVGALFLGLPSKRNSQRNFNYGKLFEQFTLNQNPNDDEFLRLFIYIFNIKELFEWKVLTNQQKAGFIIGGFYDPRVENKEQLTKLMLEEANKIFKKHDLKTAHFANINYEDDWIINALKAKEIYNLDIPYDEFISSDKYKHNHAVITWYSYHLNPHVSNEDLKLNVYGLYVNPWSLFSETIPGNDPNSEYTILMIHGVAADHNTWRPELEFLKQYGNVELIDLPLHDNSNVFPLNAISWDLTAMGLYVSDFIRVKKFKKLIVWGHSLGGGVAILTWFNCKDLVKGLILEDPYNPGALTTKGSFFKGVMHAATNHVRYLIWKKQNHEFCDSEHVNNEFNKVMGVYKPMSKKIIFFLTNLLNQHVRFFIDWVYMQNKKLKTLVMFGANDFVINEEQSKKYFESLTPNYEYYVVPNANHSSHTNNPKFVMEQAKKYFEDTLGLKPVAAPINPPSPSDSLSKYDYQQTEFDTKKWND